MASRPASSGHPPKVSIVKKSQSGFKSAGKPTPGGGGVGQVGEFVFFDNEDDTATVWGVNAGGNQVDIAGVATLAVTSSDTTTISVDPPSGMTFKMHGLKATTGAPVTITATATWNDGSVGPFTFDLPCQVTGTPATGIKVVPGTPVVR